MVYRYPCLFLTARNAIIVILAAGIAALMLNNDHDYFTLTGNITAGLPDFAVPSFTIYDEVHNHTMSAKEVFSVRIQLLPIVYTTTVYRVYTTFQIILPVCKYVN